MANREHYSSDEFKPYSEYKSFTAEVYAKPKEIVLGAKEISDTAPETQFGAEVSSDLPKSDIQKSKESMRSKVKSLFDSIKGTTAKAVGTASISVVIAASAIIGIPEITDLPFFGNLSGQPSEDDPTPPMPEYTATLDLTAVNKATVLWGDTVNTINIDNLFTKGTDDNCLYRVTLFGKGGETVKSIVTDKTNLDIEIDAAIPYVEIMLEEIYRNGEDLVVFDTTVSDAYHLSKPKVVFLDGKVLKAHGYYLIPYRIESAAFDKESYNSLEFTVTGQGETIIPDKIIVNEECYIGIYMDSTVTEFTVSAALDTNGAYGGHQIQTNAQRTYVNEPELHIVDAYFKYADPWYDDSDTIVFDFKYSAPVGSYLVMVDNDTGGETVLGEYENYHYLTVEKPTYNVYYKLVSESAEVLCQTESFVFDSSFTSTYDVFNYKNPGEVTVTYNQDGTMNVYVLTDFASTDPNVYYEIILGDSVYKFKEPLAKIENIPLDSYALQYRVCVDDANGIKYVLTSISVSGTVDMPYLPVYLTPTGGGMTIDISYNYDLIGDTLWLSINGETPIIVDKSAFVYDENTYSYTYTVEYSDNITAATLEAFVAYNSSYYTLVELYGTDMIKGAERIGVTEEFSFEDIETEGE